MASAAGPREFQTDVVSVERVLSENIVSNSVRFALWVFVLLSSDCFTRRRGRTPQEIAAMEPNGEGRAWDTNQKRRKRKSKCLEAAGAESERLGKQPH